MKSNQQSDTSPTSSYPQDFSRTSVSFYPSPYSLAGTYSSTTKNNQSPYDIDENTFGSIFDNNLANETEEIVKNNKAREEDLKKQKTRQKYVTFILGNESQKEHQYLKDRTQKLSPNKNLQSLNFSNRAIQTSNTDQRTFRKSFLQSSSNAILSRKLETAKTAQREHGYLFGQPIFHSNNHDTNHQKIESLSRRSPVLSIIIQNRI